MKNLFALLLLVACLGTACRDDFQLEADYQDIPIAYAYLETGASRQFVRVEKAFLQPGGDALAIARIADSIYYGPDQASVFIERTDGSNRTQLQRVNGEDFTLNRVPGIFIEQPNVLYTFTNDEFALTGGNNVRLVIERPNETPAEAVTSIIEPITIQVPSEDDPFINTRDFTRAITVRWDAGPQARVFDLRLYFQIREIFPQSPDQDQTVTLEWVINNAYVREDGSSRTVRLVIPNESFYQFLGNNLEPKNGVFRLLDGIDFQVTAVGSEIESLLQIAGANAGITSSQAIPAFTNVTGGRGIVTSRSVDLVQGINLAAGDARDSLRNSIYTRTLGFQ